MSGRRGEDGPQSTGVDKVVWWLLGLASALIFAFITAFTLGTRDQVEKNTSRVTALEINTAVIQNDLTYIRTTVDSINKNTRKR